LEFELQLPCHQMWWETNLPSGLYYYVVLEV
jgi:hypothetical protein